MSVIAILLLAGILLVMLVGSNEAGYLIEQGIKLLFKAAIAGGVIFVLFVVFMVARSNNLHH